MSIMFFSEKERIKSLSHAHNTFLISLLFVDPFIFYALLHLKKSIKTVERKMRLFFSNVDENIWRDDLNFLQEENTRFSAFVVSYG